MDEKQYKDPTLQRLGELADLQMETLECVIVGESLTHIQPSRDNHGEIERLLAELDEQIAEGQRYVGIPVQEISRLDDLHSGYQTSSPASEMQVGSFVETL